MNETFEPLVEKLHNDPSPVTQEIIPELTRNQSIPIQLTAKERIQARKERIEKNRLKENFVPKELFTYIDELIREFPRYEVSLQILKTDLSAHAKDLEQARDYVRQTCYSIEQKKPEFAEKEEKMLSLLKDVKTETVESGKSPLTVLHEQIEQPPQQIGNHEISKGITDPDPVPNPAVHRVENVLVTQIESENTSFESIRLEYAREQAKWKKEQGELKVKFNRIMEDLFRKMDSVGEKIVEKVSGKETDPEKSFRTWNPPERTPPEEFNNAKKEYSNAKKEQLRSKLEGVSDDSKMEAILVFEQEEFDIMQKLVQEELTDKEQSLHKKVLHSGLKKWRELSPTKRIAISSTLMGVGGAVAFGSGGIVPVAGAVAYRAFRGGTGALASYGATRGIDALYNTKYAKEREAKRKKEVLENTQQEYTVDLDKYEEIEAKTREYLEEQQRRSGRKNLYKVGAALTAGGLTNWGMNVGMESYGGLAKPAVSSLDTTRMRSGVGANPALQGSPVEQPVSDSSVTRISPSAESTTVPKVEKIVETDLNSKGFIQTFDDLKKKILTEYGGDQSKLPDNLKKFVNTSSTKLAIDNGLYDPTRHASAIGLKGEHLSVDQDGHLTLKHLGNKPAEVIDTGEHKFNVLHKDKMFVQKPSVAEVIETGQSPDVATRAFEGGSVTSSSDPVSTVSADMPTELEMSGDDVALEQVGNDPIPDSLIQSEKVVQDVDTTSGIRISSNGERVWQPRGATSVFAQDHMFNGKNILKLSDGLQDGTEFAETRSEFVEVFNKLVTEDSLGKKVIPVSFEKGIAHIIQGEDNKVNILLNGKEIARGVVDGKGAHVKLLPGMAHNGPFRFFFADSVYERAFSSRAIKNAIKTLTVSEQST